MVAKTTALRLCGRPDRNPADQLLADRDELETAQASVVHGCSGIHGVSGAFSAAMFRGPFLPPQDCGWVAARDRVVD